ncbi:protein FAR1-RELATED SEQUENCE 5-like, partial [Triticum dicoccoides]|uniref:protein FAR1-RELATED SEQUENCE 5-like n=1 Tax=Triticum dicoccoides TaxID=85692 RepID=UPI0018909024
YFDEKAKEDPDFFYRIRLDDEDRVRNMYCVDGAARRAYKHFRDCMSFDATYLTNMYKMPCAPFIGINNHNQLLQFGCGLVRNEDTDGYVWLFKTFLECMDGLAPMNIITNQDFSMRAGIEQVFPLVVHRHCRWHIIRKAEETLGPFFADRPDLHKEFELWVDHSLTVEEFERSWMAMTETHQTTQRSEGFNAVLKRYVSPGNSLLQFAKQYTALQQKILGSELQHEANTTLKQPKLLTYLPMERQMSKIYTNKIFNKFQEEIKRASMFTAFQVDEPTFKVCSILGMSDSEPEDPDKGRNYFVTASIGEGEFYCQCCKFERDGIVCCHILKVMDMNAMTRMPRHFIRRRWTWDADDALAPQTTHAVLAMHDERPESTMEAVRHVVLTKNYAELIDEACKSDDTARVAEKHRKALKRELDEIKKRKAEEALHRFPRTSSVPSSTGPSSETSEIGSRTASTQTQVDPISGVEDDAALRLILMWPELAAYTEERLNKGENMVMEDITCKPISSGPAKTRCDTAIGTIILLEESVPNLRQNNVSFRIGAATRRRVVAPAACPVAVTALPAADLDEFVEDGGGRDASCNGIKMAGHREDCKPRWDGGALEGGGLQAQSGWLGSGVGDRRLRPVIIVGVGLADIGDGGLQRHRL